MWSGQIIQTVITASAPNNEYSPILPRWCAVKQWLEFFRQFLRHSLRFFVYPSACVEGLGFKDEFAVLVGDTVAEIQPHALDERWPDFNRQQIIVTRGRFVAQPRLDDGKNHVLFLPVQDGVAE